MNRPNSLARLLNSIHNTDFVNDDDKFDVEIHVDKSMGLHYDDCVTFAKNFTMPEGRGGKISYRIEPKNQ